jgi:hypothetical protein
LVRTYFIVSGVLASACAPTTQTKPEAPDVHPSHLAQFMRESVNVPFSFAVLERDRGNRSAIRIHRAAVVLNGAAQDLGVWRDPPARSEAAQIVFYEYARALQRGVAKFERAARDHDTQLAATNLDEVRHTCNSCHRFFRPAGELSDVGYAREGAL